MSLVSTLLWFNGSSIAVGEDYLFPLSYDSASNWLYRFGFSWDTFAETGLPFPALLSGTTLHDAVFLYLFYSLGLPASVGQKIYIILLNFIGSASAYYLTWTLTKKYNHGRVMGLFSALLYLYNPYLVTFTYHRLVSSPWNRASLPLVLALCHRGLETKRYRYALLLSLTSIAINLGFPVSYESLFAIAVAASYALCYLIYSAIKNGGTFKGNLRFIFIFFLIAVSGSIAINLYWIVPFLATYQVSSSFLSSYSISWYPHSTMTLLNNFRLLGIWTFYTEHVPYGHIYIENPLVIASTFALPILVSTALLTKPKDRHVIFYGLVGVAALFMLKGINPPFGELYRFLVYNLPLFKYFYSSYKFSTLLFTVYNILGGIACGGIYALLTSSKTKMKRSRFSHLTSKVLYAFALTVLVITPSWPLITGDVFTNWYSLGKGVTIPDSYFKTNSWLKKHDNNYRILILPRLDHIYIANKWGYQGTRDLYKQIFTSPLIEGSGISYGLSSPHSKAVGDYMYRLVELGTDPPNQPKELENSDLHTAWRFGLSGESELDQLQTDKRNYVEGSESLRWTIDTSLKPNHGHQILYRLTEQDISEYDALVLWIRSNTSLEDLWLGTASENGVGWHSIPQHTLGKNMQGWSKVVLLINQPDSSTSDLHNILDIILKYSPNEDESGLVDIWIDKAYFDYLTYEGPSLWKFFALMNIKYMLFDTSMDTSLYPYLNHTRLLNVIENSGFILKREDEPLLVYENPVNLSHVYAASKLFPIDSVLDIMGVMKNEEFNLSDSALVYRNATILPLDQETTMDKPVLEVERRDPTCYEVRVVSDAPFVLVLSETFDCGWVARVNGDAVEDHFVVNGYANGWLLGDVGSFTITITYEPQKTYASAQLTAVVSYLAITAILLALTSKRLHDSLMFSRRKLSYLSPKLKAIYKRFSMIHSSIRELPLMNLFAAKVDYLIIFFAAAISTLLWFHSDSLMIGGDYVIVLNPRPWLPRYFFAWNAWVGGGLSLPSLFTYSPLHDVVFLSAMSSLGLTLSCSQKLLIILLQFIGAASCYYLLQTLIKSRKHMRWMGLFSALFYLFNPLIVSDGFVSIVLTHAPRSFAPLAIAFFIKGLQTEKMRYALLLGLVSLPLFSVFPGYVFPSLVVAISSAYTLYHLICNWRFRRFSHSLIHLLKFLFVTAVIAMAVNAYWLAPFLFNYGAFSAKLQSYPLRFEDHIFTTLLNVFRLHGVWPFFGGTHSYANVYLTNPVMMILTFIPPLLAFTALLLRPRNGRVLLFACITVVSLFLAKGVNQPFGEVFSFLVFNLPFFNIFHHSAVFLWFLMLEYCILIGVTCGEVLKKIHIRVPKPSRELRIFSTVLLVALVSVNAWPLLTGDVGRWWYQPSLEGVKIPECYYEMSRWLDLEPESYRIFLASNLGSSGGYVATNWGFQGTKVLYQTIFPQSLITGGGAVYGLSPENTKNLIQFVYRYAKGGEVLEESKHMVNTESVEGWGYSEAIASVMERDRILQDDEVYVEESGSIKWVVDRSVWGMHGHQIFYNLTQSDLSEYDALVSWLSGNYSRECLSIGIEDSHGITSWHYINDYVSHVDPHGWLEIEIPLEGSFDSKNVSNIIVRYDVQSGGEGVVIVHIANTYIAKLRADDVTLGKLLALLNAKYILVDESLDTHLYPSLDYQRVLAVINSSETFRFVCRRGHLVVYENALFNGQVYAASSLNLVNGDLKDALESVSVDSFLPSNSAFILANQSELPNLPIGSATSSKPVLEVERRDPTCYEVRVVSDAPFVLVLSETFDCGWVARVNGDAVEDHFVVNGYANGWLLDDVGAFTITITYEPQKTYVLALVLSILGISATTVLLVLILRRDRKRASREAVRAQTRWS